MWVLIGKTDRTHTKLQDGSAEGNNKISNNSRRPVHFSMQVPLHDQMMLEVKSTLSPVTASETGGILDD